MTQLRLIPLVVIAALGLLTMKALQLLGSGSVMLAAPATTQSTPASPGSNRRINLLTNWDVSSLMENGVDTTVTGSSSAHEAPEDKTAAPAAEQLTPSNVPVKVSDKKPVEALPLIGNTTTTESRLMEKLSERRKLIEDREKEMEIREGLLKATEGNIEKRIDDLKSIEDKIGVGASKREETKIKELADLVKMYESMKAKDAARIFDRLESQLLVDIAKQMNPKKLADIVAKMSSESADKLTVGLANRTAKSPPSTQGIELPKIDSHDG